MFQVQMPDGEIVELDDNAIVPPGGKLVVPLSFMDAATREIVDDLKRRNPPKKTEEQLDAEIERLDAKIKTLDDEIKELDAEAAQEAVQDAEQRRSDAYLAMKARLDTVSGPNRRNRWQTPLTAPAPAPKDPSYQSQVPWRPRGKYGNDAAPSDAEARRAAAYFGFKARLHSAGPQRRSLSSPPAGDAASERWAHIERLQRAFFRER